MAIYVGCVAFRAVRRGRFSESAVGSGSAQPLRFYPESLAPSWDLSFISFHFAYMMLFEKNLLVRLKMPYSCALPPLQAQCLAHRIIAALSIRFSSSRPTSKFHFISVQAVLQTTKPQQKHLNHRARNQGVAAWDAASGMGAIISAPASSAAAVILPGLHSVI